MNQTIRMKALEDLVNYPMTRNGLSYTASKHPMVYVTYTGDNFEKVKEFCFPLAVEKTKRFERNKRITVHLETGLVAVNIDDIILQVCTGKFMILKKEEFTETFHG